MRRVFGVGFLLVVACLLVPASAFAGIPGPEIDPSSAVGGLALVMTSAALVLERRRRR